MFPIAVDRMQVLGTLLASLSGVEFVWRLQNFEEPTALTYLSGRLVSMSENIMNDKKLVKVIDEIDPEIYTVNETNTSIEEYMLCLSAKGVGVNKILKEVSAKTLLTPNRNALLPAGLCFVSRNPVIDLTGIQGQAYIERANLDIRMRSSMVVEAVADNIKTITFTNGGN